MVQNRWNSPMLRSAIAMLIVFGLKEAFGFEVGNEMVNTFVDFIFLVFFGVAAANNPEKKNYL